MKNLFAIVGFVFLFVACQVPGPGSPNVITTKAGLASLKVTISTNGFRIVSADVGALKGREVISPSGQAGVAYLTLSNAVGTADDITGDSNLGLSNVPPGLWDLTVVLRNLADTADLATTTLTGISLLPGPNTVPVTLNPTMTGFGGINVQYQWPQTAGITSGTFNLYHWEGSWVEVTNPVPSIVFDADNRQVDYTLTSLTASQYKLVLWLKSGTLGHPPVTSTINVYSGMVSDHNDTPIVLAAERLNGPPAPVAIVSVLTGQSRPYIDWSLEPTTATAFRLNRNGANIYTATPSTHSFVDYNAIPGEVYNYEVVAENDYGFSSSTPGNQLYKTVAGVSATGPLRLGVGQSPGVFVKTLNPSDATLSSVTWSTSAPQNLSLQTDGIARALGLGDVTVKVTSDEIPQSPLPSAFSTVSVSTEAWVSTFTGQWNASGITDGPPGTAQLWWPSIVAVGYSGLTPGDRLLYSFNIVSGDPVLRIIDRFGNVTTPYISSAIPSGAVGAAVTGADYSELYFTVGCAIFGYEKSSGTLRVLAGDVSLAGSADDVGANARFNYPRGLALVGDYLYVSDTYNNLIRKVDIGDGTTTTYAANGTADDIDGPLINASVYQPTGIVFDGVDNFYVTSGGGYNIRKISVSGGEWSTVAGTSGVGSWVDGPGATALFSSPEGLAIDGGFLYVADGRIIRRITLPGPANAGYMVSTIAGPNNIAGYIDGLGLDSRFGMVTSLAADGGVVYVSDTENTLLRKINTSIYDEIYYDNARFNDTDVMHIDGYNLYHTLETGNGVDGTLRVGTVLLYTTNLGNHGKLLITGIDTDVNAVTGLWRLHLDWTTWDAGGTIISQGSNLSYLSNEASGFYIDFDTGTLVNSTPSGDMYLAGTADVSRRFDPASNSLRVGLYQ